MDKSPLSYARIGNFDFPLVRCKLRAWLILEDHYANIIEAAEEGNREKLIASIYSHLSAYFSIPINQLDEYPWFELVDALRKIQEINMPSLDFPLMRKRGTAKEAVTKMGWEYQGRSWYIWLHSFAAKYGWNIEYISNLEIDDGIALLQEMLVDDQLEREWQWSCSENAYSYDATTKTSRFIPLERPSWMAEIPKEIKKVKVRASMLPVGTILKWDTDDNEFTKPQ